MFTRHEELVSATGKVTSGLAVGTLLIQLPPTNHTQANYKRRADTAAFEWKTYFPLGHSSHDSVYTLGDFDALLNLFPYYKEAKYIAVGLSTDKSALHHPHKLPLSPACIRWRFGTGIRIAVTCRPSCDRASGREEC